MASSGEPSPLTPAFGFTGAGIGVICALFAVLMLLAWMWWRARRAATRARDDRSALLKAIDDLPDGIAVFDADDRLTLFNRSYASAYARLAQGRVEGARYEELIRGAVAGGWMVAGAEPGVDWLARFLEWHRRPDRPWLQEMRNNRWLQLREQRLPDGRTAVAYSNVTELVRAQQGLRSAELAAQQARAQLEDGIGALAEAFALWDPNDCLVVCNQRYHELFWDTRDLQLRGVAFETIIRAGVARGHVPAAVGREEDWIADRLERHRNPVGPILHPMPDDHWLHVDERRTRDGGYVGIRADVTELVRSRRELQQLNARLAASEARTHAVISTAASAIVTIDAQGTIVSLNAATERLFGYPADELCGRNISLLMHDDDARLHDAHLARPVENDSRVLGRAREVRARHADGRALVLHLAISKVDGIAGTEFVGVITDLTERKRFEEELQRANERLEQLSMTDGLTGVANRRHWDGQLKAEWMRGARHKEPLTLLMVDIDHFKRYNDHYGHVAGDACLQQIALLLKGAARRSGDLVARYGGEEFALLLPSTDADAGLAVAQRCVELVRQTQYPHADSPTAPHVSISVGVASCVPDGQREASVITLAADAALYRAKESGRNRAHAAAPLAA